MSGDTLLLERALLGLAAALVMAGAVAAWTSPNAIKRLASVLIASFGAMMGLAALAAPTGVLVAGVAVAFAYLAIGAALIVRLQEGYSAVETPEIDAADEADEPREPPL